MFQLMQFLNYGDRCVTLKLTFFLHSTQNNECVPIIFGCCDGSWKLNERISQQFLLSGVAAVVKQALCSFQNASIIFSLCLYYSKRLSHVASLWVQFLLAVCNLAQFALQKVGLAIMRYQIGLTAHYNIQRLSATDYLWHYKQENNWLLIGVMPGA